MKRKSKIAGNWRCYFSDEMSRRFDQVIDEKFKTKLEFNYGC